MGNVYFLGYVVNIPLRVQAAHLKTIKQSMQINVFITLRNLDNTKVSFVDSVNNGIWKDCRTNLKKVKYLFMFLLIKTYYTIAFYDKTLEMRYIY